MGTFINFSEVPPNATRDDIERMREEGATAAAGNEARSRSTSFSEQSRSGSGSCGTKPPSMSSKHTATFPNKLHAILSDPKYHHIIRWLPHGRSWEVMDQNAFMKEVVPNFFSFSKYASFTRQITGWNFVRNAGGPDRGSYYHELFMRGRPFLVKFMKREIAGQAKKRPPMCDDPKNNSSSWHDPDFYELSKLHPLPELSGCSPSTVEHGKSKSDASSDGGQKVASPGANQHQHYYPGYIPIRTNDGSTTTYPSSTYPHNQEGYQQWTSITNYTSYYGNYAPTAQFYDQSSQGQGQGQSQYEYSGHEEQHEHRLHQQDHSSSLSNGPHSLHVARSTDNPDGSYYGQGEHNINVQPTAHPSWPWGYPATDTATATYYGEQYQYQQGQQQGNSDQTQARGNAYDHAANFGSGGNARLHDGTSNNQNGSNESQLFPQSVSAQFLPPVGSGGNVNAVNSVHLPSLDEEQRTTLLGILGTAVVKASSHSHSDGGGDDDDAPHDNNGDSNADGNDEEGGDESDISPIRISCKSKFDPHT